tara:strand:+ start:148 stop:513 length:366 start_codon:yes stop_codon:yes gene_type:complete
MKKSSLNIVKFLANSIIVIFLISSCSSVQIMKGSDEFEMCKMIYVGKTSEIKKYFEKKTEEENIDCTEYQQQLEDYFLSLSKVEGPSTIRVLNTILSVAFLAVALERLDSDKQEIQIVNAE